MNVAEALAALAAVRYAAMPPDANHPYGHTKAEYFSAVLEGALIVLAAVLILHEAWQGSRCPHAPEQAMLGLAVVGPRHRRQRRLGGRADAPRPAFGSPALLADAPAPVRGRRDLDRRVSSASRWSPLTGLLWFDPLIAALDGSQHPVVRRAGGAGSVGGLMDEAVQPELLGRIRGALSASADGAIEAHDLRTRHAGRLTFIEFHLVVPGAMRVDEAHAICDRVEAALRAEVDGAVITIHVEPEGKAKHRGVLVL